MRLDKFMKVSRIIKRRTVANEAASAGRCTVNGRPAKPSADVKVGDILEVAFGSGVARYEVLSVQEHVTKDQADSMYRLLS